jgi:hypothetical protein
MIDLLPHLLPMAEPHSSHLLTISEAFRQAVSLLSRENDDGDESIGLVFRRAFSTSEQLRHNGLYKQSSSSNSHNELQPSPPPPCRWNGMFERTKSIKRGNSVPV